MQMVLPVHDDVEEEEYVSSLHLGGVPDDDPILFTANL